MSGHEWTMSIDDIAGRPRLISVSASNRQVSVLAPPPGSFRLTTADQVTQYIELLSEARAEAFGSPR